MTEPANLERLTHLAEALFERALHQLAVCEGERRALLDRRDHAMRSFETAATGLSQGEGAMILAIQADRVLHRVVKDAAPRLERLSTEADSQRTDAMRALARCEMLRTIARRSQVAGGSDA
ncbi:MAG: hypothetical protein KDE06_02580 [Rhodobacteraceae bacterium]|uniref:hypothetical protein n=1 Tax=Albidovulum sp. TaxID=1872424 RepID=UPI001D261F85|nr:hypothetical protein [Paracoccaceae bacterium]MCC0045925.1 hypothetical protein [Defluviimonas sp.]HPE23991.1 hypothetical protein [Albidovulum sp.]MCB2120780.1 hypothetical protein [Paracoccaceae bacterium]MCB2122403.1 hypothetical protein [Paracoccaceae bacterium]